MTRLQIDALKQVGNIESGYLLIYNIYLDFLSDKTIINSGNLIIGHYSRC